MNAETVLGKLQSGWCLGMIGADGNDAAEPAAG